MLTRKQSELLRFIHDRLQAEGVPPSFEEMKEALDLRSKSGIHRLIMALEERGFIKRLANRARAIEVLRLPESATVQAPARPRAFAPSVIPGHLGRARPAATPPVNDNPPVMVPVMGRIAAGTPIEAIQTRTQTIPMPAEFLGVGDHFALEVRGDSMVDAGIHENDTVVIRKQDIGGNRRHRRRADRRRGGDAEAAAQARRLDRARSRQPGLRDAHLRARPRQDPGQAGEPAAPLLRGVNAGPSLRAKRSKPCFRRADLSEWPSISRHGLRAALAMSRDLC